MASKNKGGREVRKPKADRNKKTKGQTPPSAAPEIAAIVHPNQRAK